jgi:predicted regulator of Ras-like GTPase activity (Roadblock/LC7/MglB family)
MAPAASETAGDNAPRTPLQNPPPLRKGDTNIFSAASQGASEDSTLFRRTDAPATDFLSRQMQPKDVVAHALSLPGVAGAVVALADGLRVDGQVPAEFNADTVAAFLPQIYERVNQSTRERMGTLNNVSFTVGNVPWKIYRVGSIYFAAFGRADENFPKAELAQLAAGLNRKSK